VAGGLPQRGRLISMPIRVNASGEISDTRWRSHLLQQPNYQSGPNCLRWRWRAIVAWQDSRTEPKTTISMPQRVNASGSLQWDGDGVPLCAATGINEIIQIPPMAPAGQLLRGVMTHRRHGYNAQRGMSRSYSVARAAFHCVYTEGNSVFPKITTDGNRGAIVAWNDYRCGNLSLPSALGVGGDFGNAAAELLGRTGGFIHSALLGPFPRSMRVLASYLSRHRRPGGITPSSKPPPRLTREGLVVHRTPIPIGLLARPANTESEFEAAGTPRRISLKTDAITIRRFP